MCDVATESQTLPGLPAPRRSRRKLPGPISDHLPVAQVVVDQSQPHLDRLFDYAVPAALDDPARPGVRVKVRFGGRDVDGFVVSRRVGSEHDGELAPLRRVVSPEVVLTPEVITVARAVAGRWIGTLPDVLRLAVPPRHARVEQESWNAGDGGTGGAPVTAATTVTRVWEPYDGGPAFLRRVAAGEAPRAVWQALPGPRAGADAVAAAVSAARESGRGALVVVPSAAQAVVFTEALTSAGQREWQPGRRGGWVRLIADDGVADRYRAFLAAVRGKADVVVGTRAAAFAPVRRLGLVVCWDDGDHLHSEPRAPYPHAREVLGLRAELEGAALLVGGLVRSVAAQRWVAMGWAQPVVARREVVRRSAPRILALTSTELAHEGPAAVARLPGAAWRAARDGLTSGPVLVQVPRAGYLPSVACQMCRAPARCPACKGPLGVPHAGSAAQCRWCGRVAADWRCPTCDGNSLRSVSVGAERTAEELARAFPGVPVVVSGAAGGVRARVGAEPCLVVATPGAEPRAEAGYPAALLLDAALVTARPGLDNPEQALRTWTAAAALVRPAGEGGVVVLVGDPAPAPAQALVRWDPALLAERELAERTELRLPPAVHLVTLEGTRHAVTGLLAGADLPAASEVLGPLPVADGRPRGPVPQVLLEPEALGQVRALVRTPWASAAEVTAALAAGVRSRSARREEPVRVRAEPLDVL